MGIEIIPNQPISFDTVLSEDCLEFNDKYCYQAKMGEEAYVQFRQTPCGDNLVEDGNFHAPYTPWVADAGWVFAPESTGSAFEDGKFCHVPGTSDDLTQAITGAVFGVGQYYRITLTVSGMSAGSIILYLTGVLFGETITENGTYSFYGTASGGTNELIIRADADFDGCVSYVSMHKLLTSTDITITLYQDGSVAPTQPTFTPEFDKDFITYSWTWPNMDAGCYTIKIFDPCDNVFGSNVVPDPTFLTPGGWTHVNEAGDDITMQNVTIASGAISLTVDISTRVIKESYGKTINGLTNGNYKLTFTTGLLNPNLKHGGGNVLNFILGATNYAVGIPALLPNSTYSFITAITGLTGTADPVKVVLSRIDEGFCTGGETIEILELGYYPVLFASKESNCIRFYRHASESGTKLIDATCETDTENLGFYWNGTFKLRQRLEFTRYAPSYPTDGSSYIFSSGRKQITAAQREKFYDVLIEDVTDVEHSALSTQIICKTMTIDGVEYFVDPADYKPDWDKKKAYPLAEIRILMMKQGTVIFNKNS